MSVMKTCECSRDYYRVLHRNHNHSHFETPKGEEHFSWYSGIVCLRCGWHFRTKAKWVNSTPEVTEAELQSLDRRKPKYNVAPDLSRDAFSVDRDPKIDRLQAVAQKLQGTVAPAVFRITVTEQKEKSQATVRIETNGDYPYVDWMCACEYLLHLTAKASGLPYDEALESLCKGAKTYTEKIVKLRR